MAETKRRYIFGAFLLSVLSVLLIIVAIASDSWVASTASIEIQTQDSTIQYGMFGGLLVLNNFPTPISNTLYMTCVPSVSACALSCKTAEEARRIEVEALANGYRPTAACVAVTEVNTTNPLSVPPVISFAFYVSLLFMLFLQLLSAVITAGLAITNATMNPTEPVLGLPGCLWTNVVSAVLGVTVLLMFGIYWNTSELRDHLALAYTAVDIFQPSGALGYSYWVLIGSVLCNLLNVGLIKLREYLLEREPPSLTLEVENKTDGMY